MDYYREYINLMNRKVKDLEERNRELSRRNCFLTEENRLLRMTLDSQEQEKSKEKSSETPKELPVPDFRGHSGMGHGPRGQRFDFKRYMYRMRLGDADMGFEAIRRRPQINMYTTPEEDSLKSYANSEEEDSPEISMTKTFNDAASQNLLNFLTESGDTEDSFPQDYITSSESSIGIHEMFLDL